MRFEHFLGSNEPLQFVAAQKGAVQALSLGYGCTPIETTQQPGAR